MYRIIILRAGELVADIESWDELDEELIGIISENMPTSPILAGKLGWN